MEEILEIRVEFNEKKLSLNKPKLKCQKRVEFDEIENRWMKEKI